jgi:signal transduction histidine kinase
VRIIDPGQPNGGTRHSITVVYGAPLGRVWHEVVEATRFFSIAAVLLLAITAIVMALLVRRYLSPIHELAHEADQISSRNWQFDAPAGAMKAVELRPLAQALESTLARVQLSFAQQKRFTSDAAHELKTDVAIVKSSLQLLSMRRRTVEEYSQGLDLSMADFTRLESTLQKLLTLARLEQPAESDRRIGAVPPSCSMRDALEEAVQQSMPLADLKAIEIDLDAVEDGIVPIDRRDAVLLCSNVLVNALQHSPEQGKVLITLIQLRERIALTIKDWGDGIAQEDRPHLFEAFYRGDVSRSRKSGGTGLGLSICKAICDRAGGDIEISNHEVGGAVVIVSLPFADPQTASQGRSALAKTE